jgi:hypothetical protein
MLVGYTILYGIFFGLNSTLLTTLIAGEADYFSASFFNIMGLIPVLFFLDYLTYYPFHNKKVFPFLFSIALGGFILLPAYRDFVGERKSSFIRAICVTLVTIAITFVMITAFIHGNPSLYFSKFFSDSLVGIMTIDWLAIYGLTIVLSVHRHKQYGWISVIPIIGFGYLLILENLRKPRH